MEFEGFPSEVVEPVAGQCMLKTPKRSEKGRTWKRFVLPWRASPSCLFSSPKSQVFCFFPDCRSVF